MTGARRGLAIDEVLFSSLISELARRGNGDRETGAFLLARSGHDPYRGVRHVVAVAYYNDLDPLCLTGGITFTADGYTTLAALCRRDGLRVVADIHTHPGRIVAQSAVDAAHPMTALPGHVALIAPGYARDITGPAELGVHILQEGGQWASFYARDAARFVRLTGSRRTLVGRTRAVARRIDNLIRFRRPR